MHMDAGMDTGNIIKQTKFSIPFERNCLDCIEYMQKIGPKFLNQTLWNYAKNEITSQQQDENQVINCKKIEKTD